MICLFLSGLLVIVGAIYVIHLNTVPDDSVKMSFKAFKLYLETFPKQWEVATFYPEYVMRDDSRITVRFNVFNHVRYCLLYWKIVRAKRKNCRQELAKSLAIDLYRHMQEGYQEMWESEQVAQNQSTDSADL